MHRNTVGPYIQNQLTSYQDTAGTVPLTITADMTNTVYGNAVDSGLPATLQYTDPNGHTQTITIQYQPFTVQTNFGYSQVGESAPTSRNLPTGVLFPDGSSYSFSYEPTPGYPGSVTSRVASMTLPTGGTIQYQYSGGFNGIEADGSIAGLTRTTADGSVSYARSNVVPATLEANGSSSTMATDAFGNQTALSFQELSGTWNFYETGRQVYAGSAGGTPLRSVATCYNSNASSCNSQTLNVPITEIYTTTTLETGLSSATDLQYDQIGNLTRQAVYDFGSSTPTKTTTIQYASLGNNILDKPQSIVETDGSNNQLSSTTLSYDDSSCTLVQVPGIQNNPSGAQGNLTTITQWINNPSGSLVTHRCYDTAGQLRSTTDPSGNVTQYTYDAATDTFLTGTTYPTPSSGVVLSTSATFDPNTGVVQSTTDSNGQTTTFAYDAMIRPTLITYPAIASGTPTRSFSYPSLNQVNASSPLGNGSTALVQVLADGYGRSSRSALYNGQSGQPYYQNDTCYDQSGRVSFTSLSYQGSGFGSAQHCSGAGDTFTYDALDRPFRVTHSDGSYRSYVYGGRATEVISEQNGSGTPSRAFQSDALGRLISVCEITSAALGGSGTPQGCGLYIAGVTGYTTAYGYNLAQHTSTVTQGVQTRIFQTDSLIVWS